MGEITGTLEEVTVIKGIMGFKDLKIVVGGVEFYKRLWEPQPGKRTYRKYKPKSAVERAVSNIEERFDKDEFITELKNRLGKEINVKFEDFLTSPIYWVMDRFHKIKIPREYREIKDINYD